MIEKRRQRIFYIAPIATDKLNQKFGHNFHVGAAANKVLGVCSALRAAGVFPVIVSGLIPTKLAGHDQCPTHIRTDGICYAKVFSAYSGVINRILISISMPLYLMRHMRRQDRVILYNFYPEYILLAIYLKLIGRPAILDIEDGPRKDQLGGLAVIIRMSFEILMLLCARKHVVVSRSLGEKMALENYLPVSGVASFFDTNDVLPNKFADEEIKILYGGTIAAATGLYLFEESVRRLATTDPDLPLRFFVTGIFPEAELRRFSKEIEGLCRFRFTINSDLTAAEYRKLAQGMDIGLSLKLSEHSIGQTTFPSKVIEYAAMGMLVCSTPISDVPYIFDEHSAIVLDHETPDALAMALSNAARNRIRSAERAQAGRVKVLNCFSKESVGRSLVDFIYE